MWQKKFEEYENEDFTIVGLALDIEGIAPAKRYYERFGVTFPALVDPDYATRFGAVPKTFFVDEHGVIQESRGWEQRLSELGKPRAVTDAVRAQWSEPGTRLDSEAMARLAEAGSRTPRDLGIATQLGSRYLALGLSQEARTVLERSTKSYDSQSVARGGGDDARLLSQAYFQLARAYEGDRDNQVRFATLSYYLSPTVGLGKQIARIIAPDKFDGRAKGDFDNQFRERTLSRLTMERQAWLDE